MVGAALMTGVGLTTSLGRADDPPTTQPAPESRDWFHLNPTEMYLELKGEYERRRVETDLPYRRDHTHRNRDIRFDELLGLVLDGDVYDPELLSYRASLELGLTQTWFKETINGRSDSERDTEFLQNYDVSFDALQSKPVSFHGYARRYEQRIPRRFLPSLRETLHESGVSALAITEHTSTELGWEWRDTERTGNRDHRDDENLEVSRFYLDHTWNIADNHQLRLQYDHDREESSYQGSRYDFSTRRDEFRLEHSLAFGDDDQHHLDTYFRYNEEDGPLSRDEIEFVPRLMLRHTDRFRTIWRYGFYRYEQDRIEVSQHKFDAEAIYEPTDDLRFTLDGYGLYERVDLDVDTYEFGTGLDVAWHRGTDLGDLNVNAAVAYNRSRTHGDGGRRLVRNEGLRMSSVIPTWLRERNVLPFTIVAHNTTRTQYYVPGVDYHVVILGDRVRIRRGLTGRIAEGQVVYFDYQYVTPADSSIDTVRSDFLIEHAFEFGLTPYYAYEGRCEDVDSERGFWRRGRDNQHRHRFGLRYGQDRYEIGTELEVFDDTIEPYDAWHLTGRADLLRSPEHSLDLAAKLSRYWFEGGLDDRDVWWFDADLTDRVQLNQWLSLMSGIGYRWEDDSADGQTNGVDLECGLEFVRGALSMDLTFEYDLLALQRSRERGMGVYLNIRRDLSHLLARGKENRR